MCADNTGNNEDAFCRTSLLSPMPEHIPVGLESIGQSTLPKY